MEHDTILWIIGQNTLALVLWNTLLSVLEICREVYVAGASTDEEAGKCS